jgi:hypothetical protein
MVALGKRPDGSLILPGAVEHVADYDFAWSPALPSDATAPVGTVAASGSNGVGKLNMTTGTTQYSNAEIDLTSKQVDLTAVASVLWEVYIDINGASQPAVMFLTLESGSTAGATYRYQDKVIRARATGSTDISVPLAFPAVARTMSIKLGLLILPLEKTAALLIGDQVVNAGVLTTLVKDIVIPKFVIQTPDAGTARTVGVRRMTLRVRTT